MDKAKAVYDTMMAKDWFSQWMQIELLNISNGHCKLRMRVRREMLNGFAIIHGGVTFALADSAFAFASNSHGRLSVSQSAAMSYVKPVAEEDYLIAEAVELTIGYKMATYDVTIRKEDDDELIALFRGTVYRTSKDVLQNKQLDKST